MSISSPFILRPVATSLLGLAIFLCGVLGFVRLPVSSLPQVDFPTIQVTTQFPGANPDTVASLVTAPLERQFGQIPSMQMMSSVSSFGLSQVTLQFDLDRDIDAASQDVQSAINAASSTLPRNLPYPPVYSKVNPADSPIVTLALTSTTSPQRVLSDLADTLISPRLSEIGGVGRVSVQGGIRPAVRIQVDLARLAAYKIGVEELRLAIVGANVAGSKGALDGAQQSYIIAANDQITAAAAYRDIVIASRNGTPVLLRDVAEVIDGLENVRVGGWANGQPAVIIDVQKQPGANIVQTMQRLRQEIPRIQRSIPAGVTFDIVNDRTTTIRASIKDVEFTLVLSAALVVLVVLLFLRTVPATLIAAVALPLSILATFAMMWVFNFSLDNLSLMALTIGTGFIVDDAIVMIENIVRNLEGGKKPLQAALDGAREIGFTVVSLTCSLIAVFIPLLFMTGLVGRMFREFALTLTLAVIVSAVISLTLTPMMCAGLLRRSSFDRPGLLMRLFDAPLLWMGRIYASSLTSVLRHQTLMIWLTVLTALLTVWLYIIIPKGFLPPQDTGLLTAVLEASPDVSFNDMVRLQDEVSAKLREDGDVTGVVSVLGIGSLNTTLNTARLTITLRPHEERASAQIIAERLRQRVSGLPGTKLYIQAAQDIQISTRSSRSQFQYTLATAYAQELATWSQALTRQLARSPILRNVAPETQEGGLQLLIDIDREKAGRLGVSIQNIADTLNSAFGQRQIATIYAQSNQYRVILEAAPQYQTDPAALQKLYVTGAAGVQTPLESFALIKRITAPLSIAHQEQFPAATISFDLASVESLGDAVAEVERIRHELGVPDSLAGSFNADAAEFQRSLESEPWLILAAIVTIYLVLGILYESFIHPFTILTTLPSAGVGALLSLLLLGHDLSIIALIGIILLMGIVKKNAIMMIDFALAAEREEGLSPEDAIIKACNLRFRPIMMTTLAALLGAIPLALATGPGSEFRVPLGVTIIGGLLLSQLLTLYSTPVVYLALERVRMQLWGPRSAQDHESALTTEVAE